MKKDESHILDYLEGRLSQEQRAAFEMEMEQMPSLRNEVEDMRFLLDTFSRVKVLRDIDTMGRWKKLSFKLSLLKIQHTALKTLRYVAVIAFFPLLFLSYYYSTRLIDTHLVDQDRVEVSSAYGVVSKVILPDSSLVYLNSGSTLSYPTRFTTSTRTVSLLGEAYFIVKSDPAHRFDVKLSDSLYVSAYGTEFNINAYAEQGWVSTVLASGNVSIRQTSDNLSAVNIIRPGEEAFVDKNTNHVNVSPVNLYAATAWKDGKLVFRRAKMPEIIYRLSKHFNVEIELKNKELSEYEFSATFTTETLSEILNLIAQTSPLKWYYIEPKQQDDHTYTKRKAVISLVQ